MTEPEQLLNLAKHYIEFFNDPNGTPEQLAGFLSPAIVWQEMPNKFAPGGRTNGYVDMLKNFQIGQKYISPQTYRIDNALAQGDTVAIQLSWMGTVVQTLGPFKAGAQITAQVASFLQFQDGKLVKQIDYPCYPAIPE